MITTKSSLVHVGPFQVEKVVTEDPFPRTSLLDVLMSRLVIWPCASCWRRRLDDCRSCFSFSAIRLSKDRTWNKISKHFKGLHLYSQGDDDEGNHIMSYDTIPYDINNVENHNNKEKQAKSSDLLCVGVVSVSKLSAHPLRHRSTLCSKLLQLMTMTMMMTITIMSRSCYSTLLSIFWSWLVLLLSKSILCTETWLRKHMCMNNFLQFSTCPKDKVGQWVCSG